MPRPLAGRESGSSRVFEIAPGHRHSPPFQGMCQKMCQKMLTQPSHRGKLLFLEPMTTNLHSVRSSNAPQMCCCTPSASGDLSSGNRDL
jgi:hypothetical protein